MSIVGICTYSYYIDKECTIKAFESIFLKFFNYFFIIREFI